MEAGEKIKADTRRRKLVSEKWSRKASDQREAGGGTDLSRKAVISSRGRPRSQGDHRREADRGATKATKRGKEDEREDGNRADHRDNVKILDSEEG